MAVEYMIGDGKLGIAGTIDRVGIIDRELSVVDLKTGTRIDRPYLTAQLNGYRHLWNQSMKQNITRMYGLQLKRDGTYRLIPCEYSPIFFMLLRVYSERKQLQCRNSK